MEERVLRTSHADLVDFRQTGADLVDFRQTRAD